MMLLNAIYMGIFIISAFLLIGLIELACLYKDIKEIEKNDHDIRETLIERLSMEKH